MCSPRASSRARGWACRCSRRRAETSASRSARSPPLGTRRLPIGSRRIRVPPIGTVHLRRSTISCSQPMARAGARRSTTSRRRPRRTARRGQPVLLRPTPEAARTLRAMDQGHIRNFSIIAHIDHGKSTLADRILELTHAVAQRDMRAQVLDSMDLERERGITIKAQAVRVTWKGHQLNLIDTPGHVDFTYEVSRSLQACEGALLVVDAAQGIEAQTLANAYLAIENNLEIVPIVNKIDLPQADPDGVSLQLAELLGDDPGNVLRISAKTGIGVEDVLDAVVKRIPPPAGDPSAPSRALIFDSSYDQYRGVVAFVRVVDGAFEPRQDLRAMALGTRFEAQEIGAMSPVMLPLEVARGGRGRLRDHGPEGGLRAPRRRHADRRGPAGDRPASGIQGREADGVRGPVPDGLRRLPGAARRAREAQAQRCGAVLRARDVPGARLRIPLRFPRAAAHGDRARAARARVRSRPARHRTHRRLSRAGPERDRLEGGAHPLRHARRASTRSRSPTSRPR